MSLKQKINIVSERNSLAIRKSEKMVVIQHRVQRLDPLRNKKSERNREIERERERELEGERKRRMKERSLELFISTSLFK